MNLDLLNLIEDFIDEVAVNQNISTDARHIAFIAKKYVLRAREEYTRTMLANVNVTHVTGDVTYPELK